MSEGYEIERKFLVKGDLPRLDKLKRSHLRQGYVATGTTEVRVRQKDNRRFLTCKQGAGLQRREVEFEIGQNEFEQLWTLTEGKRIEKVRYDINLDGVLLTLDVFEGEHQPLMLAEVEFDSVQASEAFVPPQYCYLDVTQDARYKNQALAMNGIPVDHKQ